MALPFLPGNSFNNHLGRSSFHRSQTFFHHNDVPTNVYNSNDKPTNISYTRQHSCLPCLPSWVAFDKQVLCFDGFFSEVITERRDETLRIHKCKIYYYLEDGTLKVVEPKEENSGMTQGVVMKRHQVFKPSPDDKKVFTLEDLNIGNELVMYGITYKITNCDEFTKNFLLKSGYKVGSPLQIPGEQHPENFKSINVEQFEPAFKDKLKQFLDHDGQVLRFLCYWDDRENAFGEERKMTLNYYLADDTVEIIEISYPNCGRDTGSTFLRRCKLPRSQVGWQEPGQFCDETLLNVFKNQNGTNRCLVDNAQGKLNKREYYDDSDLRIGCFIDVFGRKFLVCDCDEFTKEYYRIKYGTKSFTPIEIHKNLGYKMFSKETIIPPYNGFGSHEDSLNSTRSLLPKPPKKDLIKFIENDRRGLNGNVLRFTAQMITENDIDKERKFVLSFYLVDDTMQIFEVAVKNSGLTGGSFLERSKIIKPGQERFLCKLPDYYTTEDLAVGKMIEVSCQPFIITDADDYTLDYMAKNWHKFPHSHIRSILDKISGLVNLENLAKQDWSSNFTAEEFFKFLSSSTNNQLCTHEVKMLIRFCTDKIGENVSLDCLLGEVQSQLKKNAFERFEHVKEQCYHFDSNRSKLLPADRVNMIFKSMKVPINEEMLNEILSRLTFKETKLIDYEMLLVLLNWKTNKIMSENLISSIPQKRGGKIKGEILKNYLLNVKNQI